MLHKTQKIQKTMLKQIKQYLNGEITKEIFGNVAESYYTEYAHCIQNTEFYEKYSQIIPDACLTCIDEPGEEREKEQSFRITMEKAYQLLKELE